MAVRLSENARRILTDPELIAIRDRRKAELTAFLEDPNRPKGTDTVPVLWGMNGWQPGLHTDDGVLLDPVKWVEVSLEEAAKVAETVRDEDILRPLTVEYYAYGVHFVDALLGAELVFGEDLQHIHAKYLPHEVGELTMPDLGNHPLWIHCKKATEAYLEADVPLVDFGLPTIASPLNIALNLYGQEFLIAMLADPEAAHHDLDIITELLCRLHRWFRDHIPADRLQCVVSNSRYQPTGCGQICGCSTQLISGELYAEFIAPRDEALLKVYPNPGMIHLCGSHTQHIENFRSMKHLRIIQLNDLAAEELQFYIDGLREDQVIYLNPCEGMTAAKAMEITGGRRILFPMEKREF